MPSITMSIAEAFELALEQHRAGRLGQAKTIYLQILAQEPDDPDALQLLGLIAHDENNHADAVNLIARAVAKNPAVAEYHANLGVALWGAKRFDEAIAAYRTAIERDPNSVDAHFNLGNALKDQGQYHEAALAYGEAIRLDPNMADAHFNRARVLQDQGQLDAAVAAFHETIRLVPAFPEAHYALGNVLRKLKRFDEAVAAYEQSIRLRPDHHHSHNNLGNVLREQGKFDLAVASYHRALRLNPGSASIYVNLGNTLTDLWKLDEAEACFRRVTDQQPENADAINSLGNALALGGRLDEALACYRRAIELDPSNAVFHLNKGNALRGHARLNEALASYAEALRLKPDFPAARFNRSLAWLLQGRFDLGWPEYEWRWGHRADRPSFTRPQWDGLPPQGQTVLLYTEQGFGDIIQFIRFAPLLKKMGARVVVRTRKPLLRLLSTCEGIDELVAEDDPLPAYDFQFPLMSLPIFLQTIATGGPYLRAEPARVEHWREQLASYPGLKVGIAWQGSPKYSLDALRSFRLSDAAPLAAIPGVRLFSLQIGAGIEQLHDRTNRISIVDLSGPIGANPSAFVEDAAIMMNLDLVISCDSAVTHLAGALGRPTWLALGYAPDWRWLLDREDSEWYPTVRLFRQTAWNDWPGVFRRMADALIQDSGLMAATGRERSDDAIDHDVDR